MSKELAEICITCPIPFEYEEAKIENLYTPEAYQYMKRLEFKSILARFDVQDMGGNSVEEHFWSVEDLSGAEQIFENPEALKRVNSLIHPLTWNEIKRQIRESSAELVVVEAALFDKRSREVCRYLLYVDTQDEIRIQRLMANRGYTREKCIHIMQNQADRKQFTELADFVIDNSGTVESAEIQIRQILENIGWKHKGNNQ